MSPSRTLIPARRPAGRRVAPAATVVALSLLSLVSPLTAAAATPAATGAPAGTAAAAAAAAPAAAAVAPDSATTTATPPVLRISPGGRGTRSGSSWANAGDLKDLPSFISRRPNGGEIWVRGDAGAYRNTGAIAIRSGGTATAPVVVRGVDVDGGATARPLLLGSRTAPYDVDGARGSENIKLYTGAKHLVFRHLAFQNQGTAFTAAGNAANVTVTDVRATNVRRFFENYRSSSEATANLSDIKLTKITVNGFSKTLVRLQYDTRRVLVEDVQGDSQSQDGDNFAMGVHLTGTAHDITLRRVTMRNTRSTLNSYWNGDGFASERGVYGVRFEDTLATGATDGGYDLKSRTTTLVRARASGNKRNFRFWSKDMVVNGCTGLNPVKRGGSGAQAQVWLSAGAQVKLTDCTLRDSSTRTTVFELENDSRLTVVRGSVARDPESTLRRLASGAAISYSGTAFSTS